MLIGIKIPIHPLDITKLNLSIAFFIQTPILIKETNIIDHMIKNVYFFSAQNVKPWEMPSSSPPPLHSQSWMDEQQTHPEEKQHHRQLELPEQDLVRPCIDAEEGEQGEQWGYGI